MRLTCPCCGAQNSLEALLADAAARQAVAAALALSGGLGDRIMRYLGLFRPAGRGLTWDRAARLLEELTAAIAAAQIERHGQIWPAPRDCWKQALDQMLDARPTLILPLKSHGYLYEIIAGLSRKAAETGAARREEADERARARAGERHGPQSAAALAGSYSPQSSPLPLAASGGREPAVSETGDSRPPLACSPLPSGPPLACSPLPSGEGPGVREKPARVRVPPPPDFKALVGKLTGRRAEPPADPETPAS